jgi:hypothetical protein
MRGEEVNGAAAEIACGGMVLEGSTGGAAAAAAFVYIFIEDRAPLLDFPVNPVRA